MNYKNIYTDLEPNRNFYTVWAKLPKDAAEFIYDYLAPIKGNLTWASTHSKEFTSKIPHITLRYLGYLDELNKDKINVDIEKFKKELRAWESCDLELGSIDMYYEYIGDKLSKVRLFWKILDLDQLKEMHNILLKVDGYDFFSKLEGENFNPHISLGNIDLVNIGNMDTVKEYIEKNKVGNKKCLVKDIELNLCNESIPLTNNRPYEK